jgi:hypothetical protein
MINSGAQDPPGRRRPEIHGPGPGVYCYSNGPETAPDGLEPAQSGRCVPARKRALGHAGREGRVAIGFSPTRHTDPVDLDILPLLRASQPCGLEVLQCLRRNVAPSTERGFVLALRGGEPGDGERLSLVPGSVASTQRHGRLLLVAGPQSVQVVASPAVPGDHRHRGSRGARPARVRRLLAASARRRTSAAGREQRNEQSSRPCRKPAAGGNT